MPAEKKEKEKVSKGKKDKDRSEDKVKDKKDKPSKESKERSEKSKEKSKDKAKNKDGKPGAAAKEEGSKPVPRKMKVLPPKKSDNYLDGMDLPPSDSDEEADTSGKTREVKVMDVKVCFEFVFFIFQSCM